MNEQSVTAKELNLLYNPILCFVTKINLMLTIKFSAASVVVM